MKSFKKVISELKFENVGENKFETDNPYFCGLTIEKVLRKEYGKRVWEINRGRENFTQCSNKTEIVIALQYVLKHYFDFDYKI